MKKLAILVIVMSFIFGVTKTNAQDVGVSISIAPPELPVYAQPPCNNDGYLWSPGYWAYGSDGYYWVPGVWVAPPQEGFLWTPGYWGFVDGGYFWNGGYWGENVGFYGGVCYGYGYGGTGFYGGRWQGGRFQYNTAAWHVNNIVVHNTYVDRTVINNTGVRSSFNGRGGVTRQPNEKEQAVAKENHTKPTALQQSHHQSAITNRNQKAMTNHSAPATTARTKVGGERYNSAGHSISTVHATPSSHFANPTHASTPKQQQRTIQQRPAAQPKQQRTVQQRPAAQPQQQRAVQQRQVTQPQQQRTAQPRPAAQPQQRSVQRQSQPARAPSSGGGGGQHSNGKR